MSDITQAEFQSQVADSILDAPIVGNSRSGAILEHGTAEQPEPESPPTNEELLSELNTDHFDWRSDSEREPEEKEAAQAEAAQPPEQTPATVQESLASLDATVQQYELNDAATAKEFTSEFCEAFGTDLFSSGANIEALGNTMAKTALSAFGIYERVGGDLEKIGPEILPPQAAHAFSHEFLKSWGVDPRTVNVNEGLLASTVLAGALNFIDTYHRSGGRANLDELNDPQMAEYFVGNFLKAFGGDVTVSREVALKVADAFGKYMLGFGNKLGQLNAQQPRQQSGRGRGESRSRGKRGAGPRMKSNSDLFDPDTLAYYEQQHGRL